MYIYNIPFHLRFMCLCFAIYFTTLENWKCFVDIQLEFNASVGDSVITGTDDQCSEAATLDYDVPIKHRLYRNIYVSTKVKILPIVNQVAKECGKTATFMFLFPAKDPRY